VFDSLTDKLEGVFRKLVGSGRLSEKNISDAMKEVRLALLEADVSYSVVQKFVDDVTSKAVGQEVLKSLSPGQQVIKIVHDEMVKLLGEKAKELKFASKPPSIFMLAGLQGSGKTTTAAKLARHVTSKGKRPLLVAADPYRPAAARQLEVLAEICSAGYFWQEDIKPPELCMNAVRHAKDDHYDVVIIDTAGRLHIDQEMMDELIAVKSRVDPTQILLVLDAMTGQDAVEVAQAFKERLDFDGAILTKIDGDARGGAALSFSAVTARPILFAGVGEKLDNLDVFHPDRMASRILGMGDVLTLVEKAQREIDQEKAEELQKKMFSDRFTLEDFQEQLAQMKRMGPLTDLLGMIPGAGRALKGVEVDSKEIARIEAIIHSMTPLERRKPTVIAGSRKKRIAKGSGVTVRDVNMLLKQFDQMRKMMKSIKKGSIPNLPGLKL
jgi:signal recognition particle subunit SRP54